MNAETFKQGDYVRIMQHLTSPKEVEELVGQIGRFDCYTKPHGFAAVYVGRDFGCRVFVHPENLIGTH